MDAIKRLWEKEPALFVGVIEAILVCAAAFGLELTAEQIAALTAVAVAVGGVLTRSRAYSTKTGRELEGRVKQLEVAWPSDHPPPPSPTS